MASIETLSGGKNSQGKDERFSQKAFDAFLSSGVGRKMVHAMVDRMYTHIPERLFEWEGVENIGKMHERRLEGEKVLIIATHRSHADGAVTLAVIDEVRSEFEGKFNEVVYTVAGSMKTGEQGLSMKTLWDFGVEPFFNKSEVTPDFVVSDNDVFERKMKRPLDNGAYTKKVMKDPGKLSVVHIEGSTKGGKINPKTGKLNGLQPMDKGFNSVLLTQIRNKISTIILPVAIEGTEHYFDPNTRSFNLNGMRSIFEMLMVGEGTRVGTLDDKLTKLMFGDSMRYKPGTVRIGESKKLQDLGLPVKEMPNNVMRMIAQITSPKYLGDYGKHLLSI
ncbi:MAG: hypothetical protein KBC00_03595 [Candidatus Levybacteria bacterium]|nr:hypothetical protein [Candidatus Levybacteria bacterium]MBP9815364.1 hypothetical protein [Candidatus Levybacteria bacterium]